MKLLKIFSFAFVITFYATKAFCVENPILWKFTEATPKHIENQKILNEYISNFEANGGEYVIINTTTGEYVDKGSLFMPIRLSLVFGNISRLFNYAAGLHSGIIKENEIVFNIKDTKIFDKIDTKTKADLFEKLSIRKENRPVEILQAYVKLLKNEDNYLTKNQLAALKKILFDNVATGKAKNANVDGCNVSGIASTQQKGNNPNIVLTTFIGEFEAKGQNYVIMTILDEPKPKKSTYGFNSAGWNAVILARDIIANMAQTKEESNKDLLQKKITNFSAIGGAYIIMDAKTKVSLEQEFIDYNEETIFNTFSFTNLYLTTIGLNTGILKEKDINFSDMPLEFASWTSLGDRQRVLDMLNLPFHYHFRYSLPNQLKAYLSIIRNERKLLSDTQLEALKQELYHETIIGNTQNIEYYGLISGTIKRGEKEDIYAVFIGNFDANGKEYGIAVVLDSPKGVKGEPATKSARASVIPLVEEIIQNFIKD